MAIWQFKVVLIPRRWLESGVSLAALADNERDDFSDAWRGVDCSGLEAAIDAMLPQGKSLSPSLTTWGSSQGDEIQLWRGRGVKSLGVRFDLRNPNMALFSAVIALVQRFDLAILTPGRVRMAATDITSLLRAAAESDAAHFVIDPQSFLSELEAPDSNTTGLLS